MVRAGIQSVPEKLHKRVVHGVEKELLAQVMAISDGVVVKAAARLGINRNTLQKKISQKESLDGAEAPRRGPMVPVSEG